MEIVAKGKGIYLRKIEYSDTDNIVRWRNKDSVRSHFIDQRLFTKESHEAWLKNYVETGKVIQLIICIPKDDEDAPYEEYVPVGSVYARDIDRTHNKAEYGIFIGEDSARGRGVGSKCARLMIEYCFETLHLHRFYLRVHADNLQAIKSYENAGFIREAYLKDDVFVDGEYKDIVLMAIINPKESLPEVADTERK